MHPVTATASATAMTTAMRGLISPVHGGAVSDTHATTLAAVSVSPAAKQPATKAIKPKAKAKAKRKRAPKFVWRQRDAQDSRYYNLQLDINDAKQQIQELTQYRAMLYARGLNTPQLQPGGFVRTVYEYLRVFRHGLNPAPPEIDIVAFLHGIMAADLWINEFRGGIDMVLAQWGIYATCFECIDLRCADTVALPIQDPCGRHGYVVRSVGHYSCKITHNTIAIMFPHVLRFPRLATQLIGRTLHGQNHCDFVFECVSNRILRCDVNVDFFGAFAKLLPDPHDLSIVFNGAKLESDFYLGDADDVEISTTDDDKPFKDVPSRATSPQEMRQAEHAISGTTTAREEGTSIPSRKMELQHILS